MSLSRQISAITECSICTETFTDPRVLPCVHTFCLGCLEKYGKTKSGNNLVCPLCRANFELRSGRFSELPVNFFIQKLLDINQITEGQIGKDCDACSDQNSSSSRSATVYCFDCRQSLCESCCQVHNKLRYNKTHLVVEFGKKQAEELLKATPTYCEIHSDEIVKFFCGDCQVTICMVCYVEEHNNHKCSNILKASGQFCQELEEERTKVSDHISVCLKEEEKVKRKRVEFLEHMKQNEELVVKLAKDLHKRIEEYEKQILIELSSIQEVKLKEIETTHNEILDRLAMMKSFKEYTDEVLTKATPSDIARLAQMLKKRATDLHAMKLDYANDLCKFDIEIRPVKLKDLSMSAISKPKYDVTVYSNRSDHAKAVSTPSITFSLSRFNEKMVHNMKIMEQELFLISKCDHRQLIGAEVILLPIPPTHSYSTFNYSIASYTQCNSIAFQLLLSQNSANALHLNIKSIGLTKSDTTPNSTTTFHINLRNFTEIRNANQNILLTSFQKLRNAGVHTINANVLVTGGTSSLTVTTTLSYSQNQGNISEEGSVTIPLAQPQPQPPMSSTLLEVYGIDHEENVSHFEYDVHYRSNMIGASTLRIKLPDTFLHINGTMYNRTNLIQSDSVMLHIQMNRSVSPSSTQTLKDTIHLKISKLTFMETDGNYTPSTTLKAEPYKLKQSETCVRQITLKSNQVLKNHGFHGINFQFQIETTTDSVKVEVSIINLNTTNLNFSDDATIEISTETRTNSFQLRRTLNLPKDIDPTDLASCTFHQCVYIGDRKRPGIIRLDSNGKSFKWQVNDVPSGLSVTSDHTLLVTMTNNPEIQEFSTNGVLLRKMKLSGAPNAVQTLQITNDSFLLVSNEKLYSLCQFKQLGCLEETEGNLNMAFEEETILCREIILFADKDTILVEPNSDIRSTDGSNTGTHPEIGNVHVATGEGATQSDNHREEIDKSGCVALKGSICAAVDRFGFVFLLTASDAKVHLLSPQLNYLCELIALDQYGMTNPNVIEFHNESGTLYVGSNSDYPTLLGFQVTDGKVDPSVWNKVV